MMNREKKARNIDEYISFAPEEVQVKLNELRKAIKSAAPKAEEKISYSMPAFAQNGILAYFSACKNHIGFYPMAKAIVVFKNELKEYKCSKGTVQFTFDKKLPIALIKKIIKFNLGRNLEKKKSK